uniref:Uncharacterized protein n=1 Tax=uncultured Caudovirales phage TaxID=2100421 RepID=A0A6J5L2T6_9CAUD|nr:hypothetical protein UFOVP114_92 [uncultured Caudovirales phage]
MPKTIASYTHAPDAPPPFVNAEPGAYYVSVRRGTRDSLALGPFPMHQQALDRVDDVRAFCENHDPAAYWDAYGTCRWRAPEPAPAGKLNHWLLED